MDVSVPNNAAPKPNFHKYSCMSCHKRKVKCDRQEPCGYCQRHDEQCVYEDPAPPRKRKRPVDGTDELRARLHNYEMQLRQSGATIDENGNVITPPSRVDSNPTASNGSGRLRTLVPMPSPGAASTTTQSRGSGTLADALRDALVMKGANDGRLITDQGNTRYLEKYVLFFPFFFCTYAKWQLEA
jgi:hypothetical protein